MRIGGLASGIDTESIINDLMKANRIPLNKITQKKQYAEWQVANYRSTNLEMKKFSDNLFKNQILSNNFNAKTVEVSDPGAVSVKNKNSTADFSGTLRVGRLAKSSTLEGGTVDALKGDKMSSKLSELGATSDGKITITAMNDKGVAEPIDVEYKSTDTLKSLIDNINKKSGVTAFVDPVDGRIGMSAKFGGNGAIEIEDKTGSLATEFKLVTGSSVSKTGETAVFEFNGMTMERSTNTFELNGFEFTLKNTTTTLDGAGKLVESGNTISFSSSADTEKIFDNVMQFVNDYNELIETLNDKIKEPKYRDFHPLSAEEKADMKENEIKLWEEKAMSGTLKNDPIISSLLSEMRTALMGQGKDADQTLKSIGITTSSSYMENGKLVVDEAALKAAISENPDRVHKVFASQEKNAAGEVINQGFAQSLRSSLQAADKKIQKQAGTMNSTNNNFSLGKNMIDMDKQIARFEDRLQMTESRLWKQFQAMEIAIQRANSQSASLMNSIGGM